MRVSPAGLAFTENNEGFSATLYKDNGKWCIGFGHDVQPGESFTTITRPEAEQLLSQDFSTRIEPALNKLVPSDCTQNQFDALADFAYNEGTGALAVLLSHGWYQVPLQLPRWCYEHVNGVPEQSPGLLARRQKEVALFQS